MAINSQLYHVAITFTEPALGTVPANQDVYRDYIESKKPEDQQDEEYKTVEAKEERGYTTFHAEPEVYEKLGGGTTEIRGEAKLDAEERPILLRQKAMFAYDYTWRGFLKEGANALRQIGAHDVKGVKTKIDQFVFVYPRRIFFLAENPHKAGPIKDGGCGHGSRVVMSDGKPGCSLIHAAHGVLERPLRADTPMGPRVALARSDMLAVGTRMEFDIKVLAPKVFDEKMLRLCFERGEYLGWGQWRTGSWGRFSFTLTPDAGNKAVTKEEEAEVGKVAGQKVSKRGGGAAKAKPAVASQEPAKAPIEPAVVSE